MWYIWYYRQREWERSARAHPVSYIEYYVIWYIIQYTIQIIVKHPGVPKDISEAQYYICNIIWSIIQYAIQIIVKHPGFAKDIFEALPDAAKRRVWEITFAGQARTPLHIIIII